MVELTGGQTMVGEDEGSEGEDIGITFITRVERSLTSHAPTAERPLLQGVTKEDQRDQLTNNSHLNSQLK